MLIKADNYDRLYQSFAWDIPARFNMGVDVCDKPAARRPDAPALIVTSADGDDITYSFAAIRALSNQAANTFLAQGLSDKDRIGVLLPQSVEAAATHVAAWKAGLISIPLFTLFGEDALKFRLRDSAAAAVVAGSIRRGRTRPTRRSGPGGRTGPNDELKCTECRRYSTPLQWARCSST